MFRSLSNWQKGVIFYVLTLIMALAVVTFGPDRGGPLQILNMLTPTVGVLLLLLVVTPDGYQPGRLGWFGSAPAGMAGMASGPDRPDGHPLRLVRSGLARRRALLEFRERHADQLDHHDRDQLGLRDIRGDRLAGIPCCPTSVLPAASVRRCSWGSCTAYGTCR